MQLQWASAALQSDRQSGDLLTMTMRRAERMSATRCRGRSPSDNPIRSIAQMGGSASRALQSMGDTCVTTWVTSGSRRTGESIARTDSCALRVEWRTRRTRRTVSRYCRLIAPRRKELCSLAAALADVVLGARARHAACTDWHVPRAVCIKPLLESLPPALWAR